MRTVPLILRHLLPGVAAILLTSGVLLLSDLPRARETAGRQYRVALMQMASQPILDEGAAGVLAGLREAGYVEGESLVVSRFNAEGDVATAGAMAQEITGGGYDLVVTLSTPALQAVANANQKRRVPHVFGMVSDPSSSGVGVGQGPLEHPPYMVGIGTLPPADKSIELARQVHPGLKRLGVVWNPAEINSEIATKMAREACQQLQIELLESPVENTSAVREAALSLLARDVDALWVGGDVTVLGAIDVLIQAARKEQVPVFTCIPGNAAKGTLFDLGANYYEVGRTVGRLAGRVLNGEPIPSLPWERAIPPKLFVNTLAEQGLSPPWTFTPALLAKADSVIDAAGTHEKAPAPATPAAPARLAKKWTLRLLAYNNSPDAEESADGVLEGLRGAGLVEGKDFEWQTQNAQGDIAALTGLVDAAVADRVDLILTVSTPTLQAAAQRARGVPVVFTFVANPFIAGVGTDDAHHPPFVTGAYGAGDVGTLLRHVRELLPGMKRVGTFYSPSEANSLYSYETVVEATRRQGVELISVGVNTPPEVPDAVQSLCSREIDAIVITNSNLAATAFPSVVQVARRARVPTFGCLSGMSPQGGVLVLSRDFHDMGVASGKLAARVMRGESPASIPYHPLQESRLLINQDAAREYGLTVPESLLKAADRVIGK
jgi:ABC-type uncharacterized transport system substrate-binding protein